MNIVCKFILFALLIPGLTFATPEQSAQGLGTPGLAWKFVAPDLETLEYTVQQSGIFSASLFLARSSLKNYRLKVGWAKEFGFARGTVKSIAESSGSVLAVNANFFDPHGDAIGLVVSRGIALNSLHKGGKVLTGIFQLTAQGAAILSRGDYNSSGVLEAVQAGPRLISEGKPVVGLREGEIASRRAGICIDKAGRLLFFSSSSTFGGLTMNQLQHILLDPTIGCFDALNLDGGGSAQIYIGVKDRSNNLTYEQYFPSRDPVPVTLMLQEIKD